MAPVLKCVNIIFDWLGVHHYEFLMNPLFCRYKATRAQQWWWYHVWQWILPTDPTPTTWSGRRGAKRACAPWPSMARQCSVSSVTWAYNVSRSGMLRKHSNSGRRSELTLSRVSCWLVWWKCRPWWFSWEYRFREMWCYQKGNSAYFIFMQDELGKEILAHNWVGYVGDNVTYISD